MKAGIKTFPCGDGDCIFMKLEDAENNESYNIMIDCGVLTNDIVDYITNKLNKRIDLLIATHIDSDHIDGITAMLNDKRLSNLQIHKIIYNCYQGYFPKERQSLTKTISEKMNLITDIVGENEGTNIGVKGSVSLGATISKNAGLERIWNNVAITEETEPMYLGEKWGTIHFLSPTNAALDKLYRKLRQEYASVTGCKIPDVPYENWETMIELLTKLEGCRKRPFYGRKIGSVGGIDEGLLLDAKNEECQEGSLSEANKASLAFVWECNEHRVLFMGDALCSTVVKNLTRHYGDGKHIFDAIKIAHHGSKYNTSSDFCDIVDSHTYFLTGGSESIGHDVECLSKLLIRRNADSFHRQLRYNINTNILKDLNSDVAKEIRGKYNFDLVDDTDINIPQYEFEY